MFQVLSTFELAKTFHSRSGGAVEALRGLDLQVRAGEIYGFLGPNGAGKSTTIRLVLGLLRATSGRMLVLGQERVGPEVLRKIGYVPENAAFPGHLAPRSVLNMACSFHRVPSERREDRIHGLLEEVGLNPAAGQSSRELSRGMRQRLALAVALVGNPQLLVLDEPTAGFDPPGRRWFNEFADKLRLRGVTLFLSTHLLEEGQEICDRVGLIHEGRMVIEGTVEEVCRESKTDSLKKAFLRRLGGRP
jgi:ABC-2 type transport system ATP-binding protein